MEGVPERPSLLCRGWLRLVDGACLWGSFFVCPDRMGVIRYRLVIYPPGISEVERRRLRVWRGWPMWGALLWIASCVILTGLIGPRPAVLISTAVYLGGGVAAFVRAGDVRARVRAMRATVMPGYPDPVSWGDLRKLKILAATLIEADEHRQLGLISPIEYEMIWWQVYDQIQPDRSSSHRTTHWWERTA